jgi:hypothetical protein
MLEVRMDVITNGNMSSLFTTPDSSIIPIIFSHGNSAHRHMSYGLCKDLASYGYMVFALDHNDGSNSCSKLKDGTTLLFDAEQKLFDYEMKSRQIIIREKEIKALIDEIEN